MKVMGRKKIAIVGLGLIGGSMALRLHEKKLASEIIGVDINEEHISIALQMELVDRVLPLEEAIDVSDVIMLCVPVDQVLKLLPFILDRVNEQVVLDLGSTKNEILQLVR